MYDLHTEAVPSGCRVILFSPLSTNEYVSFVTISVSSPIPLRNKSVDSKVGVSILLNPKILARSNAWFLKYSQYF